MTTIMLDMKDVVPCPWWLSLLVRIFGVDTGYIWNDGSHSYFFAGKVWVI